MLSMDELFNGRHSDREVIMSASSASASGKIFGSSSADLVTVIVTNSCATAIRIRVAAKGLWRRFPRLCCRSSALL